MDTQALSLSLERTAERLGDPAEAIYARLFATWPELEALFVMDRSGAVRNEMVRLCFDALIDLCGDGHYARGLFATELANHDQVGVSHERFRQMFTVVRDVVREANGADWSAAAEASWTEVLGRVDALIEATTTA
jgi:hypothetical protein